MGEIDYIKNAAKLEDNELSVWVEGKQQIVTINDDVLARAMKNLGNEHVVKILRDFNGYLRAVNTFVNPEFIITNFERDLQTALINLSADETKGMAKKVVKNIPKAIKGIWKVERSGTADDEWSKKFDVYKAAGAKTGWLDNKSLNDKAKDFEKKIEFYKKGGKTRQMFKETTKFIIDMNEAVENGVRLSAFSVAIDMGFSEKQAASLAKNLTINFNERGEISTLTNSLWLFSNAGVQGGARLLTALKNPRVRKFASGLVVASFLQNFLNRLIAPDDYEKIDEYLKDTNWIFMLPGGKYLMVKLPYGYNVFNVLGNATADAFHAGIEGELNFDFIAHQGIRFGGSIIDAFNPFGTSGSLGQLVSPTFLDPLIQLGENKNFFGGPIRKEQPPYSPRVPVSQLHFKSVNPATKAVTNWLHEKSGGDEYLKGIVEINPEDIDHLFNFAGGGLGRMINNTITTGATLVKDSKLPELNKIPIVRKFLGEPSDWMVLGYINEMVKESGRKLYSSTQKKKFYTALSQAFKDKVISGDRYERYLNTFNNAQQRAMVFSRKGKKSLTKTQVSE